MSDHDEKAKKVREAEFPVERVRDLSERVYQIRVASYPDWAAKYRDNPAHAVKLRGRAIVFDSRSRSYMRAFAIYGQPGNPTMDDRTVRTLSEFVYRDGLGPGDVAHMLAADRDDGKKLRARSACLDEFTRAYVQAAYELKEEEDEL